MAGVANRYRCLSDCGGDDLATVTTIARRDVVSGGGGGGGPDRNAYWSYL